MAYPLGTVLASPIVGGSSGDTYGTHYSYLGAGGWQEFLTSAQRDAIPVDALGNLDASGLGSGRRRLGMLVYVTQLDTIYQLYVPYQTWSGLTNSNKVAALANNANWQIFSTGGGEAIKKKFTQNGHGFSVGNVVSFDGTNYIKGIASIGNQYEFLGIVSNVIDANNFTLTYSGYIDLATVPGLSGNTVYFVSPSIAGAITPIEPFNAGESSRPIIITQQANKGLVMMSRSFIVSDSSSTGSTGTGLRIERTTTQNSHGFSLGDIVRYSGNTYQKILASQAVGDFAVGIVTRVTSPNTFMLTFGGFVDGMAAAYDSTGTKHLSGSTTYYLSPSVAGKLTRTRPIGSTDLIKPFYQALTTDTGIVMNQRALPTFIPISGVTNLQTSLNNKVNTSLIGAPSGIVPLNSSSIIPIQYIPSGLKEEFVVPNLAARNAKFYVSGGTGTTGQTMSFRGLKVFVLNANGAPGFPVNYSGSCQFIDTTGFLNWSATTGSIFINWADVQQKPNFVNRIFGGTGITATNNGTGNTTVHFRYDNKYIGVAATGNNITVKQSSLDATRIKFQGSSGTTGQYVVRGTGSTFQTITLPASLIGPAEDGSYTDGIYTDFTNTTPVGTAIDRFNELFLLVLPPQASGLTSINGSSSFVSGNLSWGVSRNDISYANVTTSAGNSAVDINGLYSIAGTRLGLTRTTVTGVLNSNVVGNVSGIPYLNNAFQRGNEGRLVMSRNGVVVSTLVLSGTTAATSNNRMSVSAVQFMKAANGSPITPFKYRTGTFTIPTSGMTNGMNYFRIVHSGASLNYVTNYIEFVYDADATNLSATSTGLTNLTLGGTKNVSGVKYHTGGTAQYQATVANAYKNVFSQSSTAIDFPNRENFGSMSNMNVTGAGILNRTGSTLQTLPNLNSAVSNPQNTNISVVATFPISQSILLGNVGASGRIRSGFSVAHPFTTQQISGGLDTRTGFLIYNVTQPNVGNSETFTGEVNRLQARDYSALTYANVNVGTYNWDSTQSLVGVNSFHNTGMLVINDELMYPNASYLTSTYGITTGNFNAVTNSPASNVNYSAASGKRDYYRKFTSTNGATQSTLTFTIDHTGSSGDFLTIGNTGGTPSSNQIKMEFLIMRSGGAIHGWANPFALTGNTQGISNTSVSHVGTVTTVTCTLSTTPRVASGDYVIVRMFFGSSYANRLSTLSVTNI